MGRKHLLLEDYLQKIPHECRNHIELLEPFKGNRTNIAFTFLCGCRAERCLKSFLGRDRFDYCSKCKPKKCKPKITDNSLKFRSMIEGQGFVVCKICGWHAKRLASHLRKKHYIEPEFYDGPILCDSSKQRYSEQNQDNGNWIEKAKARGEDLTDYKHRMGNAVRESIMSNPDDRKRRAKVMASVNRSDVMRKKSSDTAKKTSARRDIQLSRAARIHAWQIANPKEFYEKCINKALHAWHSIPEAELFEKVRNFPGYCFKLNQFVISDLFITQTKRKQIDICDKIRNVYLEFDGPFHFKQTPFGQLQTIQNKDYLLDEYIKTNGFVLIRVSFDQFSYRKSDYGFKKECLDRIFEILDNPIPGVYRIGTLYVVDFHKNQMESKEST